MKALPNNNKPAEFFIEVYKNRSKITSHTLYTHIAYLSYYLLDSVEAGCKTIAIFKIRLK